VGGMTVVDEIFCLPFNEITFLGPDFKLTCDGRSCCCHGNVASEKDNAYW
jgi:hypothetical protein